MTTTTQSNEKTAPPAMQELDMRDYFAAKAMLFHGGLTDVVWLYPEGRASAAARCYEIADAMLAARQS